MALNLVDWMDASLHPFNVPTSRNDFLWQRDPGGSAIYLGAATLNHPIARDELLDALASLCDRWPGSQFAMYDCWAAYDLSVIGFQPLEANPWYLRLPATPPPLAPPPGVVIECVETIEGLAEFERASWLGFEDLDAVPDERTPFSWHAPATLNDANMRYLIARLDGQAVAGVISHVSANMLGIYGLSTVLPFRRRGIASALVRAAVALHPELPVCVYPDPVSTPIYTRIGFVPGGTIAMWLKPA